MSERLIAEASGRAFLGILGFIKARRGPEGITRVIGALDPQVRRTFDTPFVARKWYAYADYAAFLRAIEKTMGDGTGRVLREIGIAAGDRDLSSLFKLYVMLASAERLIRSCEKIWPVYYRNAGKMEAVAWDPEKTVLRIHFKHMDPLHCRLMEGWMIGTMAKIGFRVNEDGREVACMANGGAHHEFVATWTKKS